MNVKDYARAWESAWNSHNLEAILSHYRDDIVFRSNKALRLMGTGEIRGKDQLWEYWKKALELQPDLRFKIQDVLVGFETVVITYLNHRGVLASETIPFDEHGLAYMPSACHKA